MCIRFSCIDESSTEKKPTIPVSLFSNSNYSNVSSENLNISCIAIGPKKCVTL